MKRPVRKIIKATRMHEEEARQLAMLSHKMGISEGAVVRLLVKRSYDRSGKR